MPELPEIETVRMQLEKVLVGQTSTKCEVLSTKIVRGDIKKIIGKKVLGIERKGKVLLINFGPDLKLGFHFKMTGQLIYEEDGKRVVGGHPTEDFVNKMPSSHTRAIFHFNKGTLYFNDQRLFGWVEINPKFVDKLGPEPFSLSVAQFTSLISKRKRPIKLVLMEQDVISGVGNIYANDACWEAKINPRSSSSSLSVAQLHSLFNGLIKVLKEGIKYGGATAADAKYIDLRGMGGHYQDHFRVYDRTGLPCHRCKTKIERFELGGRGTYFCPACQR